jgi:hypothetical protein
MKEMLSLSGFGFNSKTKCLTATEEVWCHDLGSDSPFLFKSYNWLFLGYSPQHTIEG